MIENKSKKTLQIIVSSVFVFFSIFQIVAVISAYFDQKAQLINPLIPEYLIHGIGNFTTFITVLYLLIVMGNLFSIYKKGYLFITQIISLLVLISIQFFYMEMIDFFLN